MPLDPLLLAAVAGLAQRLERAAPEGFGITEMWLHMVADCRWRQPSRPLAYRAQWLRLKLRCPDLLPPCCLVPVTPSLLVAALVVCLPMLLPRAEGRGWLAGHGALPAKLDLRALGISPLSAWAEASGSQVFCAPAPGRLRGSGATHASHAADEWSRQRQGSTGAKTHQGPSLSAELWRASDLSN